MKFIIDRSTLRCGGNSTTARGRGDTQLLNREGFMCCLGHVSLQLGATIDNVREVASPEDMDPTLDCDLSLLRCKSRHFAGYSPTDLAESAMRINDDEELDDAQRERDLSELFDGHGHHIEFVGNYLA